MKPFPAFMAIFSSVCVGIAAFITKTASTESLLLLAIYCLAFGFYMENIK